ncbi:MAG TPA: pilus assembly protein N-terminal domain-containing protein [Pirellulales bacterium]|nr:pilus assembly protein N-terminal domain-containing protein [Pirellulales bacterium]
MTRRTAPCGDFRRRRLPLAPLALLAALVSAAGAGPPNSNQVVHRLQSANETLELTVNTSRILSIGKPLPRVQVNNPEVAEVTALSETQIQVLAKKPGVTQVNLFDEDDNIYSVDLIVYPDARELSMLLRTQFPTAALKVVPTATSVIVSGYVDDPSEVRRIIDIASDYAPKVLNNIKVGGVQQVLLQVKVMEVSRTKLRNFGFDWGTLGRPGQGFATNSVGGLLNTLSQQASSSGGTTQALGTAATPFGLLAPVSGTAQSMTFGVMSGSNQFFGVLNLLTQKNVAKVVAEPQLVTVSGRPASFHVGGSVPYARMVSLAGPSFGFMQIGTQVDFVPIVLGNGAIRLEVRPRVSELDPSNAQTYNGYTIPGFAERQCDTGVELRSGQTLALAGLVQVRTETQANGLAWIGDLPLLGIPFRRMQDSYNEIETLIMVTPHLVDAIDACDVPPGGPGYATADPDNHELYCKGYVEVPNCQGPNMHGPYPDSHGMFPPPATDDTWSDDDKDGTPSGAKPAAGQPTDRPSQPPGAVQPGETTGRPRPPTLHPGKSSNTNTTGFVSSARQPRSGRLQPTVRPSAPRQKKVPGFIGPTGYDLR